jgi:hypothetical protein
MSDRGVSERETIHACRIETTNVRRVSQASEQTTSEREIGRRIARRCARWSRHVGCECRKSRLCRGEEERVDTLFRPRATSTKRASEASTSPSGELWDELGRSKAAMREQRAQKNERGPLQV